MSWQTLTQSVGMAVGAGLLLLACGPETTTQDAAPVASETGNQVHAMAPPTSCDRESDVGWCRISADKVRCANGRYMYAYSTPDGWCIEYDVCKNNGGPYVCGL